ncbi:MAG: YceD family protein [Bacteroidia bacterium]
MAKKEKHIIQFAGLPVGKHDFVFELDDAFFASFEHSEITKGKFAVHIGLQKQATMLVLNFQMKGQAILECDRCGDDMTMPMEGELNLIVRLGGEGSEESDEIIVLPASANEIDVSALMYEHIILSLPLRRTHTGKTGKNACNPEVIKKLKQISVHSEAVPDPRWKDLKKIKLK